MKALAAGAVLALLWLVFGLPLTVPSTVVTAVVAQPVTLVFGLGVAIGRFASARPTETRRWSR